MRVAGVLVLLWSASAQAEQPHGKYTLDRGAATPLNDQHGQPWPSCGGEKLFGGQATFVVEYGTTIRVNGREWRFYSYSVEPGKKPRADAHVIIVDPQSKDRIAIWFRTDSGAASGILHVEGTRNGKTCIDAWILQGKFEH